MAAMNDGWTVQQSLVIARRQTIMGLPQIYAAILLTASMFLALSLHYFAAAAYLFGVGWVLGRAAMFYDPFAWELLARNVRLPKLLRAGA